MHLFVCHGTDTRDRGKHTLLSSPRSWSSSVTSSRRGSDSVLPFGESGAKRRYLGRKPLLTFWNGRDSRSGGEENKKNGRPGLARINAKTRIDRETRREHDSQEGRLGARASLGGTKEEEGERKGKKRRRRASVAAFGSKRNSEGVFRGGEDWLPRDHGPVVGVQRAPRDQEGYGQKGPSRSGETKRGGEREREREGGEYSSGSSSGSCRCQCPPSCYPRRGPPEDSGAGHGGSSGSQIFFLSTCGKRDPSKYRRGKAEIDRERRENVPEMERYPTGSILLGGLVLLRLRWNESNSVSQRPTINASNVPREF